MRIDAHQHFWKYSTAEYGWINEAMGVIRRDFLPADLAPLLTAARIDGSIAVQARQSLEETRWLLKLARENSLIKAVVGWVPLASPELTGVLAELTLDARLKGVRHVVQGESDPAFLERQDFNAGLRAITAKGLVYDILVYAHQLPAAVAFVDRHPNQVFVLDHIAKPVVQGRPDPVWRAQMQELARRQNVYCKFSGVVTEAPDWLWTPGLVQFYFDAVLEAFGPRRVMFGSDWPVCQVAVEYTNWVECVQGCAARLSKAEQARIFGETAVEAYRIRP